jgi:hypothetical protein
MDPAGIDRVRADRHLPLIPEDAMPALARLAACLLLACAAAAADGKLVLTSFESPELPIEHPELVKIVAEHATDGKSAGQVQLAQPFDLNFLVTPRVNGGGQWGGFDQLVVDVFIEGAPVTVGGFIRDPEGADWHSRYNLDQVLQPGAQRLVIPLAQLQRQNGKGRIDPAKISFVAIHFAAAAAKPTTVWFDHVRLIKGKAK